MCSRLDTKLWTGRRCGVWSWGEEGTKPVGRKKAPKRPKYTGTLVFTNVALQEKRGKNVFSEWRWGDGIEARAKKRAS